MAGLNISINDNSMEGRSEQSQNTSRIGAVSADSMSEVCYQALPNLTK